MSDARPLPYMTPSVRAVYNNIMAACGVAVPPDPEEEVRPAGPVVPPPRQPRRR